MSASRPTGARLLGFISSVAQNGATTALAQFNLQGIVGQPASEVFTQLVEFMCPPGGSVDEAIARQGMLQAIDDSAGMGVTAFSALTLSELQEFFSSFTARTIEGRVINDIASKGIVAAKDVAEVNAAQRQLHDFVAGAVRDIVASEFSALSQLGANQFRTTVDRIYRAAFGLMEALLDE
jgi:hypothetical protein